MVPQTTPIAKEGRNWTVGAWWYGGVIYFMVLKLKPATVRPFDRWCMVHAAARPCRLFDYIIMTEQKEWTP
jgi:hypothetical protein